jgi:hypothetical protein
MMAGAVFGVIAICWRRARPAIELQAAQLLNPHAGAAQIALLIHSSEPQKKLTYFAYAPAIAAGTIVALWYIGYLPEEILEWLT